ncbi:MAG TPA: GGDEF domain-containing protein [Acidisarcina sp.]|nr:GGDEF domain-containing protein [Acidisarcina sp.]
MLQLEDAAICRAVIDSLELGVQVVDRKLRIGYWSRGAEKITGYSSAEVLDRQCCDDLCLHCNAAVPQEAHSAACPLKMTMEDGEGRSTHVYLRHKLGHTVPVRSRTRVLRGSKGEVVGAVESFLELQAEVGESSDGMPALQARPRSREEVELWLERSLQMLAYDPQPFGVLQIEVDQLPRLRLTHGHDATEALMRVVTQTLVCTLHTSDVFGRAGDSGFLVIARDANERVLEMDADFLRTLAKSVEFHWWGDRIPITISVGGTMAGAGDCPQSVLARVTAAIDRSISEGGDKAIIVDSRDSGRNSG